MSYRLKMDANKPCSECGGTMRSFCRPLGRASTLYNTHQTTCGPTCARRRKSRLQKERRAAKLAARNAEAAKWFALRHRTS